MAPRLFRIVRAAFCVAICVFTASAIPVFAQSQAGQQKIAPDTHTGSVLIFPFENSGRNASLDWLGDGLAELTMERLEEQGVYVFSRQERLAALEKIGLPDSARFSHATMIKVAAQADADEVVFGDFDSDGKTITFEAQVLQISPARLSPTILQKGALQDLLQSHAQMSAEILCVIEQKDCVDGVNAAGQKISANTPTVPSLAALENFIHGILAMDDEPRARALREASRLEPAWDRPPFELGLSYYGKRDCELALPWLSRVPPNRPDGAEAAFMTGVCHLLRNDAARADASFTGLIERSGSAVPGEHLPELPEAHNNLGIARLRLGKYPEAVAEFERATTLDGEEPDYWVNLGLAKLAEKDAAAAAEQFERARGLDPADKGATSLLIGTFEQLGRKSDADALRAESAEKPAPVPSDASGLVHMARVTMKFDRSLLRMPQTSPESDPPRKNLTADR
jgi:tetratricopeptide (TPR) repeat protein